MLTDSPSIAHKVPAATKAQAARSAIGPEPTSRDVGYLVAVEGKRRHSADIAEGPILTKIGLRLSIGSSSHLRRSSEQADALGLTPESFAIAAPKGSSSRQFRRGLFGALSLAPRVRDLSLSSSRSSDNGLHLRRPECSVSFLLCLAMRPRSRSVAPGSFCLLRTNWPELHNGSTSIPGKCIGAKRLR